MNLKNILKRIPYAKTIYHSLPKKKIKAPTWEESIKIFDNSTKISRTDNDRKIVVDMVKRFNKFSNIKSTHKILDVGCGNGIVGNMSYKKFYGWDDADNPNWTGVDPLLGRATVQGVAENMYMFLDNFFDRVQLSSSIDHFKNIEKGLKECIRVMKKDGEINIRFTDVEIKDSAHPNRVNLYELKKYVMNYPNMRFIGHIESRKNCDYAITVFLKIFYLKDENKNE